MSRPDEIELYQTRSPTNHEVTEEEHGDSEVLQVYDEGIGSRSMSSSRVKASVLLGAAISQLPIWGFAMSYGVFQEFYTSNWTFEGSQSSTGIIGTTSNGVMYLSMPLLFALFTKRYARWRRAAAICGAVLASLSFLLSSFSTAAWQLVATQAVLTALGCALMYSPTTLSLGEWYSDGNRALAYGVTLSCKNIVGSACPFLIRLLLDQHGFRITMRIWAFITLITGLASIFLIPTKPALLLSTDNIETDRSRRIPWSFLKHKTFYIYSIAIVFQSCGYGIPQTYLNTYAHDVALLSQTSATLLLTLFNLPGIMSSTLFGYLSDNKRFSLSTTTVTAVSALSSALAAWLLWGLTCQGSMTMLIMFSMIFGFFAGGYSATWGGIINEMTREAASKNEAIDTGMVYGLLNGSRGIGYVVGGIAGLPLLQVGAVTRIGGFAYSSSYGPLILFTGLSTVLGGWGAIWKCRPLGR